MLQVARSIAAVPCTGDAREMLEHGTALSAADAANTTRESPCCERAIDQAAALFGSRRGGAIFWAGWLGKANSHDHKQRRYKRKFVVLGVSVLGTADVGAWTEVAGGVGSTDNVSESNLKASLSGKHVLEAAVGARVGFLLYGASAAAVLQGKAAETTRLCFAPGRLRARVEDPYNSNDGGREGDCFNERNHGSSVLEQVLSVGSSDHGLSVELGELWYPDSTRYFRLGSFAETLSFAVALDGCCAYLGASCASG